MGKNSAAVRALCVPLIAVSTVLVSAAQGAGIATILLDGVGSVSFEQPNTKGREWIFPVIDVCPSGSIRFREAQQPEMLSSETRLRF